jgi:xylulose-5-phosphate/fructose-6-phosphate phosphoketolase
MASRTMEPPVAEVTENDSISAYGNARSTIQGKPLSAETLRKIHAYWRACNYLSLGMILKTAVSPGHRPADQCFR